MLNHKHVRRGFERAAETFDNNDFVHAVSRDGLLRRLQPLLIEADTVVDLGAATGSAQRALAKRFRGARVVSVDLSYAMLRHARTKKSWFAKSDYVQATAESLPLADHSVDVVFANMLLPWVDNPDGIFSEVARVLREGGVFGFASLGPDSLQVLQRAWQQADDGPHVHRFADMHDIGDGLVRAGLADPVLDVDHLHVSYDTPEKLFTDLRNVGGRNSRRDRNVGMTGRDRYRAVIDALQATSAGGKIEVELELVYGHCWGAGQRKNPARYPIDAHNIPIRRRR